MMQLMTFDQAIEKGTVLQIALDRSPKSSQFPQSQFKSFTDLATYGWKGFPADTGQLVSVDGDLGLWHAFDEHSISGSPADNIHIQWEHKYQSQHPSGDPIYPPSTALYDQVYNMAGHTIFTYKLGSPSANESIDARFLPPLQHWSDVTYLQWAALAPDPASRRDLRRVIHCDVDNPDTQNIMTEALSRTGSSLKKWPGKEFRAKVDLQVFEALLATPNVRAIAYMLAQRKGEDGLGWKTVTGITVWKDWLLRGDESAEKMRMYVMIEVGDKKETEVPSLNV